VSKRYIAEVKVTEVEYAGDHDRELIVAATYAEADSPTKAASFAEKRLAAMLELRAFRS